MIMGFDVLVVCYEFLGIFGGFCCCVGFSTTKLGRFEVKERGTSEERTVMERMIWIFKIWVFVVVWILIWRERERGTSKESCKEKKN